MSARNLFGGVRSALIAAVLTACVLVAALLVAAPLTAQQPTWSTCADTTGGKSCTSRGLSRAEREEAQALYNAPATRRVRGPFTLLADSVIHGALAVIGGPVTIAGTIEGALLVINADVQFAPTATVTGDVAVLGGTARGASAARIGALRVEGDTVPYSIDDGVLHLEAPFDEIWRLLGATEPKEGVGIRLALTRTYNRVEGLPIEFGPRLRYRTPIGTLAADLFAVVRTGDRLEWTSNNVGHSALAELRLGRNEQWVVGGRLFDVVAPVESWQLSDVEVGLASFLGHSDYRDYYDRNGGSGTVGYRDGRWFRTSLEISSERWGPRRTLNPFTLWRNNEPWRPNPEFDRARYVRAHLRASFDTRTDPVRPRSGWWLQGDYEIGDGRHQTFGTEISAPFASNDQGVRYGRAMLDLRRYSRLSRSAQLNARLIAGGRVHGDPLPLQRRLSISGPGANGGFGFRDQLTTPDRLQCTGSAALSGSPALCDRIFLASVDYRHDIRWLVDLFGGSRMFTLDRSGAAGWVLFSDVGRGWLHSPRSAQVPPPFDASKGLDALHTSIGGGLELGQGGIYVAKALGTPPSRGVQVFVRLVRRY